MLTVLSYIATFSAGACVGLVTFALLNAAKTADEADEMYARRRHFHIVPEQIR